MITVERDDKGLWIMVAYDDRTVVVGPFTDGQACEVAHALLTEVQEESLSRLERLKAKGLIQ